MDDLSCEGCSGTPKSSTCDYIKCKECGLRLCKTNKMKHERKTGHTDYSSEAQQKTSRESVINRGIKYAKEKNIYPIYPWMNANLPMVSGLTCLNNGGILVSDSEHRTLTLYDELYMYKYQVTIPIRNGRCTSVCHVEDDKVAVGVGQEILFYRTKKSIIELIPDLKINLDADCGGIASNSQYLAIACDIHKRTSRIKIFDRELKFIREIKDVYKTSDNFRIGRYFDLDRDGERVYISCGDTLACVDFDSRLIWQTYVEGELKGLTTIGDSVLVTNTYNYSGLLLLIAKNGETGSNILEGNQIKLEIPEIVLYNSKNNHILVTCQSPDKEFTIIKALTMSLS